MTDDDLVVVGDDLKRLEPTPELRFVARSGLKILQQKWSASGDGIDGGYRTTFTQFKWKDVPLELEG